MIGDYINDINSYHLHMFDKHDVTTKKFDAIVEKAGKVDANYAAQIEGYCSLLGEYGKKFEAVCAMLQPEKLRLSPDKYREKLEGINTGYQNAKDTHEQEQSDYEAELYEIETVWYKKMLDKAEDYLIRSAECVVLGNFADEVTLGTALSRIVNAPKPAVPEIELFGVDVPRIRRIIDSIPQDGYIEPHQVQALLHAAGISLVDEFVSDNKEEVVAFARRCGFPVVAKVVGPVHKSDVGGVVLNIKSEQHLALEFERMMQIADAKAIMVQPMLRGTELFIGAKYEEKFGHVVLCGLGGIFVEVLKDVSSGLAPLSYEEAYSMIHSLRAYKIIQGTRGQKGVNEDKFAEIIVRLSTLLRFATEIKEMDINPLLATEKAVIAVDARIRIEK